MVDWLRTFPTEEGSWCFKAGHWIGVMNKHTQNFVMDWILSGSPTYFSGTFLPVVGEAYQTQSVDYVLLRESLKYANLSNARVIADVGSGQGRLLAYLLRKYPNKTFLGYEVNPQVAEESQKFFKSNPRVRILSQDVLAQSLEKIDLFVMFNPFKETMLISFLEKVEKESAPAEVLYLNCPETHVAALQSWRDSSQGLLRDFKLIELNSLLSDIQNKRVVRILVGGKV